MLFIQVTKWLVRAFYKIWVYDRRDQEMYQKKDEELSVKDSTKPFYINIDFNLRFGSYFNLLISCKSSELWTISVFLTLTIEKYMYTIFTGLKGSSK